MAQDLITKEDILDSFLVTSKYKEPGSWPHVGIAACKITCTDQDGKEWVSHQVYRNDPSSNHVEINILNYLRNNKVVRKSSKTVIKVYQNYSPCGKCAEKICEYMNSTRDKAEMTITFANFYNTHVYPGNSQGDANANIEGLERLYNHGYVTLQLFGVHFKWKRFLGMSQFFSLSEEDKNECLDKADSPRRKDRERQDQMVWDEIFSADEITSGLEELRLSEQ